MAMCKATGHTHGPASKLLRWHVGLSSSYVRHVESRSGSRRPFSVASLRQQQRDVVQEVLLSDQSVQAATSSILKAVSALKATTEFQQLYSTFSALPAAQPAQAGRQVQGRRNAGSSPWGFALRQPAGARPPAASTEPARQQLRQQRNTPADMQLLLQLQAQQQQQAQQQLPQQRQANAVPNLQSWDLRSVQHFTVLGLGSMSALLGAAKAQDTPSSRLGFRLMQCALAVALQQHMLPGLTSKPLAYDPDFDATDAELLGSLGFVVPPHEPSLAVTGPTLFYMPCCPRQLYSDVLEANWHQLHQVAILGTSLSSLSNTQALFTALVEEGAGAGAGSQSSSSNSSSSSMPGDSPRGAAPLKQQPAADMVSEAFKEGWVVEVLCPDCAAHGVGVSLHTFRPATAASRPMPASSSC